MYIHIFFLVSGEENDTGLKWQLWGLCEHVKHATNGP